MANIEITAIHNNPAGSDTPSKLNDEYIVIKNMTPIQKFNLTGDIVSDMTPTGKDTHLFHFPETLSNGQKWTLDPGEVIYLMTGRGQNVFINDGKNTPQFHFHMQRDWFVWNNPGDTAYLRLPNGEFIHWMKVP
jgi:hypothetical protein